MSKLSIALVVAVIAAGGTTAVAASSASPAKPTTAPGLSRSEAANARAAVDLLHGSFTLRQPRKYAEKYIDANTYIQHNPTFADGREAFISGVEGFLKQAPDLTRPLVRTIAEGDLVVVEGSVKTGPDDPGTVVVDTFRFNAAGKIVEHWDALQPVAATSLNGHPQV